MINYNNEDLSSEKADSTAPASWALIRLVGGELAMVDLEDYDSLSQHKWRVDKDGYARAVIGKYWVSMHRHVTLAPKGTVVDHKDLDKLNNRKCNLRICSIAENGSNYPVPKTNTSGFKGVHWAKSDKKWIARIKVNNKRIHIGSFSCKIEAARAYNEASIRLHGEFGRLNEIP